MKSPKKRQVRMVAIADLHCGHLFGLTPPEYWLPETNTTKTLEKQSRRQRELWNFYAEEIEKLKPIDRLVVVGDAIDGKGKRSGTSEQALADRVEQCKMAAQCIDFVGAKQVGIIYGTPYHTGDEEDWEDVVASQIKTPLAFISGHKWVDINGTIFDFKHFIGGSSIPHGRYTALAREKLWNREWHSRDAQQPKANFLVRAHVHYAVADYDPAGKWTGIILPALMGYGSKYGIRQCSGTVDIGFVVFDIDVDGATRWRMILAELPSQKVHAMSW